MLIINAHKFIIKLSSSNPSYPGVLCDCFKLKYAYLNEGDKVCVCYSCLKLVKQAHLHVGFFAIFFIKRASHKRFYLYLKLLKIKYTSLNKKNDHGVSCD